jgi:(p)ppGpp synthase/HD superfamily hydrolase
MLDGMRFYRAWEALEMARALEEGFRKDGKTPKFHHQLQVARLVATLLPHLQFPEETLAVCFLHDMLEDHPQETSQTALEERFGTLISRAVWAMSKKSGGLSKSPELYYAELSKCPIASIAKVSDRIHNIHTMQGAYSPEKQRRYTEEIDQWFFPLIKEARRRFPRQYAAYENLKIILLTQRELLFRLLGKDVPNIEPKS